MSNRSDQLERGHWQKDKSERGIYQRGNTWYIRYRDQDGRMRAERVGPSKALALKVYAKRKTEIAERRFFPATGVLWEEIVDDAIRLVRESYQRKHPGRRFKSDNYGIIRGWFLGRAAEGITPSEITARLASHTAVSATFNRFRVAISHTFKLAVENKKVKENPGALVKMLKENNERVRYLLEGEEEQLRAVVRQLFPGKEHEIDLALHTGARWEEMYSLRWANVNLIRNMIKVVEPKGGKDQYIPVNSEARQALLKLKALTPTSLMVCPAANGAPRQAYNGRLDYDQHRAWWHAVLETAALTDFHWHDLRHTFASRLVMRGVDIFTVCRLMRHKDLKTTMRYAHLADKHLASAVDKLVKASDTLGDTAPIESSPQVKYLQ